MLRKRFELGRKNENRGYPPKVCIYMHVYACMYMYVRMYVNVCKRFELARKNQNRGYPPFKNCENVKIFDGAE